MSAFIHGFIFFFTDIIQTQLFSQFLEKRTFHSELDEAFSFFDGKMDRYETQHMLDNANESFEPNVDLPIENARVYLVAEVNMENLQPVCKTRNFSSTFFFFSFFSNFQLL
jgi:hypothetical protein